MTTGLFKVTKPILRQVAVKTHLDSLFLVFVLILHEFQSATARIQTVKLAISNLSISHK